MILINYFWDTNTVQAPITVFQGRQLRWTRSPNINPGKSKVLVNLCKSKVAFYGEMQWQNDMCRTVCLVFKLVNSLAPFKYYPFCFLGLHCILARATH